LGAVHDGGNRGVGLDEGSGGGRLSRRVCLGGGRGELEAKQDEACDHEERDAEENGTWAAGVTRISSTRERAEAGPWHGLSLELEP
jgi:hypothetical protein